MTLFAGVTSITVPNKLLIWATFVFDRSSLTRAVLVNAPAAIVCTIGSSPSAGSGAVPKLTAERAVQFTKAPLLILVQALGSFTVVRDA